MLCEVCHQQRATVYLQEIVNGRVAVRRVCGACAMAQEPELPVWAWRLQSPRELLARWGASPPAPPEPGATPVLAVASCPECGLSLTEFWETGRFGCPACYTSLLPLVHRRAPITAPAPAPLPAAELPAPAPAAADSGVTELEIGLLQERLGKAVAAEEYELAAQLRDRLRALQPP